MVPTSAVHRSRAWFGLNDSQVIRGKAKRDFVQRGVGASYCCMELATLATGAGRRDARPLPLSTPARATLWTVQLSHMSAGAYAIERPQWARSVMPSRESAGTRS